MKIDNSFKAIFASMMIVSGLVACDKPGPAETAGKKIDEASERISTSTQNSIDKVGNTISEQERKSGRIMSDTQITAKVKALLLNEPGLKSTQISVETSAAVVTLSGSVKNQQGIDKAIQIAKSVDDVASVTNKLVITK